MLKKLPTGIQDFEKLRENNFLYIDKTEYVYSLSQSKVPYFLSRPRRFGKSLLLSTFKAYWEGRRDLFRGLALERLENKSAEPWIAYPVFYFDFNGKNYQRNTALEEILADHLQRWESIYGAEYKDSPLEERFQHLLVLASQKTGRRCVVLVDEYDKPLLDILDNAALIEHNKAVFKGFFSTLKSHDAYLQFVLITGVSKFNKVSIFSDINQLEDISFDEEYAGICGITEEELQTCLAPEIERMAEARSLTVRECAAKLKQTYDGYRFSAQNLGVYNPYSLLMALKKRKFGSYWFETGTPSFLVERLKEINFDIRQFSGKTLQASEKMLSDYRADNPDPVPLLYQTGYLTVTAYDDTNDIYTLGFPNREVEDGFLDSLMPAYVGECGAGSGKDILTLKRHLESGNTEGIKNVLTALFAGIPYPAGSAARAPFEHYFQTIFYIIFTLLGKYTACEVHTFQGRIDCVVETGKFIYLFEIKRDTTADEALQQIDEKDYSLPYSTDTRRVLKIGCAFSSSTRMLADWKVR